MIELGRTTRALLKNLVFDQQSAKPDEKNKLQGQVMCVLWSLLTQVNGQSKRVNTTNNLSWPVLFSISRCVCLSKRKALADSANNQFFSMTILVGQYLSTDATLQEYYNVKFVSLSTFFFRGAVVESDTCIELMAQHLPPFFVCVFIHIHIRHAWMMNTALTLPTIYIYYSSCTLWKRWWRAAAPILKASCSVSSMLLNTNLYCIKAILYNNEEKKFSVNWWDPCSFQHITFRREKGSQHMSRQHHAYTL